MITKALVLLCVLSAAVSRELSSVMIKNYGFMEPNDMSMEAVILTDSPCTTPGGAAGECTPFYRCKFQEPQDLVDLRSPKQLCESYLDICCTVADRIEPIPVPATTVTEATQAEEKSTENI